MDAQEFESRALRICALSFGNPLIPSLHETDVRYVPPQNINASSKHHSQHRQSFSCVFVQKRFEAQVYISINFAALDSYSVLLYPTMILLYIFDIEVLIERDISTCKECSHPFQHEWQERSTSDLIDRQVSTIL